MSSITHNSVETEAVIAALKEQLAAVLKNWRMENE